MNKSQTVGKLSAALSKLQAGLKSLPKSASGYGYKYTPLEDVLNSVLPMLAENELSISQMPISDPNGGIGLTTILMHSSGEFIEDSITVPLVPLNKMSAIQAAGATFTYLRRYSLSALLGVSSDEDIDGAENEKPEPKRNGKPENPSEPFPGDTPEPKKDKPIAPAQLIMKIAECKAIKHLGAITSKYAADYHVMSKADQDKIQETLTAKIESLKGKNHDA